MTNNIDISADVYSVVTIPSEDVQRVTSAYLYGHTTVEIGFDLPNVARATHTAVVLKTTATEQADYDQLTVDNDRSYAFALLRHVATATHQLATTQVDRFASGLYPGRVCGSLQKAHEFVLDISK